MQKLLKVKLQSNIYGKINGLGREYLKTWGEDNRPSGRSRHWWQDNIDGS